MNRNKIKCFFGKHDDIEGLPRDRNGFFKYRCKNCGREEVRRISLAELHIRQDEINERMDFFSGLSSLRDADKYY